jgi:hypothetical protein
MKAFLLSAFLGLAPFSLLTPNADAKPDLFWFDQYGNIAWADEKARLDNFAVQLMYNPNDIGYLYVRAGYLSCKGEAQARAVRARNYLIRVRHVNWNRIIWLDTGFGEQFEVGLAFVPRGKPPLEVPFQPATERHVIKACGSDPLKFNRRVKPWRANKSLDASGGSVNSLPISNCRLSI